MGRDLEWESLEYYWRYLPFRSRMKLLGAAIKFHAAIRLRALIRFKWALIIEGVIVMTLIVLASALDNIDFAIVAGIAIGIIAGGTLIFWLIKDIPREQ